MSDHSISIAGEQLILMPERAAYWPRERTLFVADIHLGKAAAFRALAVPIPEGNQADDLARLTQAIERTDAQRIVILGDVLHAKQGRSDHVIAAVAAWRASHRQRHFLLIRGNHDVRAGDPPAEWRMDCADEPFPLGPFALRHTPDDDPAYVLAGHLHPAVVLRGRGGLSAKLPCFVAGARRMILPAFGSFTGGAAIARRADDQLFAVADGEVIEIRAGL
jgi:DNA ligase-associated metallophosphoesterase